jgi:hypothetical protein
MTADLLGRVRRPFAQAVKDAGVEVGAVDHVVLVGGSSRMPSALQVVEELTGGRGPRRLLDPEEAVAIGAALQAGLFRAEVKDVLLLDVTPMSIGIETKGGIFTKLIERNTSIPTKRSEIFTTAEDNQPSAPIQVYQGEREIAASNTKLAKFELTGLPSAPRGVPQIEVTFDVDPNGILHVSATDLGTGKEQSMTITGRSALPKKIIARMRREINEWPWAKAEVVLPATPADAAPIAPPWPPPGPTATDATPEDAVTVAAPSRSLSPVPRGDVGELRVFISYSHRDERHRRNLDVHLSGLRRQNLIADWHDRKIDPGDDWASEIDQALNQSNVVLCLVSPDFLASDYCYGIEMTEALRRHDRREALVVPIVVRPTDWHHTPLARLQALPSEARPVTMWPNRDKAWLNVVHGLRQALQQFVG